MTRRVSGVIVAGGRSRRFGDEDKALYPVDGAPMLRRVADRLVTLSDELVVNCRADQRDRIEAALDGAALDPRLAIDTLPDRGPVYGLRTALRVAAGEYAVAVSCDRPFVSTTLLQYLLNRARSVGTDCVVPRVDGRRQPLCAVYRGDAGREACEAAVERNDSRLQDVLDSLSLTVVEEATVREYADRRSLADVDTKADLAALTDEQDRDTPDADV